MTTKLEQVTVTGASGYVGRHLVPALSSKFDLTAVDRVNTLCTGISTELILSDLCDKDDNLVQHFSEFHGIVVHLAAARSDTASLTTYKRDNLRATENLLSVLTSNNVIGFVHVSSVAAIVGKKIYDSKIEPANSDDWYRYTKYLQEKLVEDWCEKNNTPLIILLPSAITSGDDENFDTNVGRLKKYAKFIPIWPQIDVKKSMTSMSLIVDAIMKCCDHLSEIHGCTSRKEIHTKYLLLDKPTMTITEILRSKHGVKKFVKIPYVKGALVYFALILGKLPLLKTGFTVDRALKLFEDTNFHAHGEIKDWDDRW